MPMQPEHQNIYKLCIIIIYRGYIEKMDAQDPSIPRQENHDQILEILSNKDEITWQSLLFELVKSEQMDPWDIDVSLLSKKYLFTIKKLKEMDLVFSGKVVLAAALLLKIKSTRLLNEDMDHFDNLISGKSEDLLYEDSIADSGERQKIDISGIGLIPRTPQPRKRKVSIYDLVDALRLALETDRRRLLRIRPIEMIIPENTFDISAAMKTLYAKISEFFVSGKSAKLTFADLVPSEEKKDKILTFIPLLHLTNQRKIDLMQDIPFGEIEVRLNTEKQVEKELAQELGESG